MSNDTCSAHGQRHSERGQLGSVSLIARRSHAARCARPDGISALLAGKVETDCADRSPRRDKHDSCGGCAGTWHGADLGCGRCDLDRFADCRGSRGRLETIRIDEPTSYEILTYVDRGTSVRDSERQGSTRPAAIRNGHERDSPDDRAPPVPLLRIDKWKETADMHRQACGIELILPDWLYTGVLDDALVLTIDRANFDLTGGFERWLFRPCENMAAVKRAAAALISCTSTPSRAADPRSSTLLTTCASSSVCRLHPRIGLLLRVTLTVWRDRTSRHFRSVSFAERLRRYGRISKPEESL